MILAFPNVDDFVIPSTPPTKEEGLKDGSVIPSTAVPTIEEGLKDASVSTPPTMEEGLKEGSVIPSSPPTKEGLKEGSVIPSSPPTKEDPKEGSVIPSSPPIKEDPKDEGVIAKTANLTIDDTKNQTPDNPNNDDSASPSIPPTNGDSVANPIPNPSLSIITTNTHKNISFSLFEKLNRGVIVDVRKVKDAEYAAYAGAKAVAVTMEDPGLIKDIKKAVKIPVMVKVRVGHFGEAKILETTGLVDYIDESGFLAAADGQNYINKHKFRVPFVCGCGDFGEVLNRMNEGAALIRIDGDVMLNEVLEDTVAKVRNVMKMFNDLKNMEDDELFAFVRDINAPYDLVVKMRELNRIPVPIFAAGAILKPSDALLMMHLGCDGVFVGNQVFEAPGKSTKLLRQIVQAVANFDNPRALRNCLLGENGNGEKSLTFWKPRSNLISLLPFIFS